MTTYPVRTRRWTRQEYHRLGELGILPEDERVELLDGQLIVAKPKGTPHTTAVSLAVDALRRAFGAGWLVRQESPVALDGVSEPEPDVVVVPGAPRDYLIDHPARPVLVVEVADTSLLVDRHHKGSAYARAGLPDYWIVNLADRRLEVYRRPGTDPAAEFGWRYLGVRTLAPGAAVTPLALPDARIAVADLLP
jgi:Uma2 family endonuclease